MKSYLNVFWCSSSIVLGLSAIPVSAQITPDGSLPTNITSPDSLNFTIENGARSGTNLFHSFQEFSVPTNGSAFFNNAADVQNIFSRITGGNISNIDGLLRANGGANLFLLNPAGIVFGPNARLDIGGSFFGTTADSVIFADGFEFSATDTTATPLLTISIPVGLQMGANAGSIQVSGIPNIRTPNTEPTQAPPALQVTTGQTLGLAGSEIVMSGGNLIAPDGQVELWAVRNAEVSLNSPTSWQLTSDPNTALWGNILLRQTAFVDTSGADGGAIQIRARGLTLQEGSNISSSTSSGQGRGIVVRTSEFINLLGASAPGQIVVGFGTSIDSLSDLPATGRGGDVTVETGRLYMTNGAWIYSSSSGNNSRSGDVTVRASEIEVLGGNPFFLTPTSITTTLFSGTNNESGKISVEANRIVIADGGIISTALVNLNPSSVITGKSGDISIRSTESLDIAGATTNGLLSGVATGIGAVSVGQAGNITIETGRLQLTRGGTIRSTLSGSGTAGNINIQATEVAVSDLALDVLSHLPSGITVAVGQDAVGSAGSINLTADSLRVFNGGQITSSSQGQGDAGSINLQVNDIVVEGISQPLSNGVRLPSSVTAASTTSAKAGSVTISSDTFDVRNGAEITVSNTGGGNAGNLQVEANRLQVDGGSSLRSEVAEGNQGNIGIEVEEVLSLRSNSQITTSATGLATGGNITIDAPTLVGLENSDIIANAVQGAGGNIQITTQGIFGLENRPELTPESDISASSQFGVSGNIAITNPTADSSLGVENLPQDPIDPSQQIAAGCQQLGDSQFIATGRGGIPAGPDSTLQGTRIWDDVRDVSALEEGEMVDSATVPALPEPLAEATTWRRNDRGQIELVAVTQRMSDRFLGQGNSPNCDR